MMYKYAPPPPSQGLLSYIWEFVYCWVSTAAMLLWIFARNGKPTVIQSCNPPDTFALLIAPLKLAGVKFVFDHHDLCPELYEERFGRRGAAYRVLRWLESVTFRCADEVISTNTSYRAVAIDRGKKNPDHVTVVRTGPSQEFLDEGASWLDKGAERQRVVHYHGVMGPQDGVDLLIRAAALLVHDMGRKDLQFRILGSGDEWDRLSRMVEELDLSDTVEMPGHVPDDVLFASMGKSMVAVCPDPPGPLNSVSTMNKTMEYMAFGLPSVCFDLPETRQSAGDGALYVSRPTAAALASGISTLLDDSTRRATMGAAARARIVELSWASQVDAYVRVFGKLCNRAK